MENLDLVKLKEFKPKQMRPLTQPQKEFSGSVKQKAALARIYLECPILPQIVTRFSYFVSPLLPSASGDLRLVDSALISGIDAYVNELNQNGKARAFIVGIIDCALDIINGRVIRGRHGDHVTTWIPFTEPIGNWIERERIESIIIDNFEEENQVQSRSSLARVAIMVHILSFEEYSAIGFSEA